MSKKTFLRGAVILGIAGLIVQVMGAVFRIPLGNIIGDVGMGYYQTVYPLYIFLLVFSTNGAPAAISKMISERIAIGNYHEAHRVYKLAFVVMLIFGIVGFSIFFFGAEPIVKLLGAPEDDYWGAYYCMLAIAPALLFVPIMAVFRGYFQGMQTMAPTAISQLTEQLVRVVVGLSLAIILFKTSIEAAAAGASLGTSIGPIAGTIAILIIYAVRKKEFKIHVNENPPKERQSSRSIIRQIIAIAVPVTIGVSIFSVMNMVDTMIVVNRLQDVGMEYKEALSLYGQLSGFAIPIINIPQALALSMALSMVPAISSAKSVGDHAFLRTNVSLGLRTSFIIGVPCAFGLMALAEPILLLIYPAQEEVAMNVASCLFILAFGVIFLAVAQTMAGVLQGIGRPWLAVINLGIGAIIKAITTYYLVGLPDLDIDGAAIGSTVGFFVVGVLNVAVVMKLTKTKINVNVAIVKPCIAGLVMWLAVAAVYYGGQYITGSRLVTVLSICVGAAVYVITLIKVKAISGEEIKMLPKGEKLFKILRKIRLV